MENEPHFNTLPCRSFYHFLHFLMRVLKLNRQFLCVEEIRFFSSLKYRAAADGPIRWSAQITWLPRIKETTLLARHQQNVIIGFYVWYIHELIANGLLKTAAKQTKTWIKELRPIKNQTLLSNIQMLLQQTSWNSRPIIHQPLLSSIKMLRQTHWFIF